MATGQTLLDTMEIVNPELQLQSGEVDVARGLVALNRAQDYLESIIASERGVKGDTVGTVTTSASTESTAFPTGVLRIDRLQRISSTTSRPELDLMPIRGVGSHADVVRWPIVLDAAASPGAPEAYYTNGRSIYWAPLPDGTYTVRWYGFQVASDITASGTFAYEDICILPLASFAARLLKIGLEDDQTDIATLAENTFRPTLKALANFQRDGAIPLVYRYNHSE